MRVVFVRTKTDSTVFFGENRTNHKLDEVTLQRMKIIPKAGSSSKNIILGLKKYNLVSECEEWKFWDGAFQEISLPGQLSVKLFPCSENLTSPGLERYIHSAGQPDILWVEGCDYPPYIRQIFELCPASLKIVYSKDWKPWKIKKLDQYDLCLVDEDWEVEKVKSVYPGIHCFVWDKLIDYESTFYPMRLDKVYDICYVAYFRERKNHELLFNAMAKIKGRDLKCVCVGEDRKGHRKQLQRLVDQFNMSVHFTGEVTHHNANHYVNQSKIGVMCSRLDAAPRAILEYMAADVPVLVNSELLAGARYVGANAGLAKSPQDFHLGIAELLDNYQSYSPRASYLEHYSMDKVVEKFSDILRQAGCV